MNALLAVTPLLAAALITGTAAAQADPFPNRPIHLLVGAPAGSSPDNIARMLAEPLAPILGQPIIIENRPGAGTMIAAEVAARAAPDGYTLHLTTVANTINQTMMPSKKLDFTKDFEHLAQLVSGGSVLVVPDGSQFTSLDALIKYARAAPGKLSYATPGVGTSSHLSMELLSAKSGIEMVHVPYKAQQFLTDLLGGRIDVMFLNQDIALPLVESGKLKALGVTTTSRMPRIPDVLTLQELGIPNYEVTTWGGISVPDGVPHAIRNQLSQAILTAAQDPAFINSQITAGSEVRTKPAAEFTAFVAEESDKWATIIQEAGIQVE